MAWRRWLLGPQPRSGAMLVLTQVSDPGLVEEDQPRGVNFVLVRLPALPPAGDIGSILLGGPICFF
jgi:hypothetical protein